MAPFRRGGGRQRSAGGLACRGLGLGVAGLLLGRDLLGGGRLGRLRPQDVFQLEHGNLEIVFPICSQMETKLRIFTV